MVGESELAAYSSSRLLEPLHPTTPIRDEARDTLAPLFSIDPNVVEFQHKGSGLWPRRPGNSDDAAAVGASETLEEKCEWLPIGPR